MVGFAAVGVIGSIVIGIRGIRYAGDFHCAAVGGIGVVRTAAHLGDECLPPAPLGHHGQALVGICIDSISAAVLPQNALNLTGI